MSAIDKFIDNHQKSAPDARQSISVLAACKPLRVFLTEIAKLSKADWARLTRHVKILYQALQASALSSDMDLADEFVKYPHFAAIVHRIKEGE